MLIQLCEAFLHVCITVWCSCVVFNYCTQSSENTAVIINKQQDITITRITSFISHFMARWRHQYYIELFISQFELFLVLKRKKRGPTFRYLFRCLHQGIKSKTFYFINLLMKGVALLSVSASNIWRVQHSAIRAYWEPYIMKAATLIIIEEYNTLLWKLRENPV